MWAGSRISVHLMAVMCQIFGLGHILINYVFSASIATANGDCDCKHEDSGDGVCRATESGDYYAAKTTPPTKTFALRVLQHPVRQTGPV